MKKLTILFLLLPFWGFATSPIDPTAEVTGNQTSQSVDGLDMYGLDLSMEDIMTGNLCDFPNDPDGVLEATCVFKILAVGIATTCEIDDSEITEKCFFSLVKSSVGYRCGNNNECNTELKEILNIIYEKVIKTSTPLENTDEEKIKSLASKHTDRLFPNYQIVLNQTNFSFKCPLVELEWMRNCFDIHLDLRNSYETIISPGLGYKFAMAYIYPLNIDNNTSQKLLTYCDEKTGFSNAVLELSKEEAGICRKENNKIFDKDKMIEIIDSQKNHNFY